MKQQKIEMCLKVCILFVCFLLPCGALRSGYNCDSDCRMRRYFYIQAVDRSIEVQFPTCLFCTVYRCAPTDKPVEAGCKATDIDQFERILDTPAICSFSPQEIVEADLGHGVDKFQKFGKVYICAK